MNFRNVVLGFVLLLLGACSSVPKVGSLSNPFSKNRNVEAADLDSAANNDENPVEASPTDPSQTDPLAINRAAPAAPPTPPRFFVSDLMGLNVSQLDGILGSPSFVRREGAGQFRRYASEMCNLIIILQRDVSGRVVSTQLSSRGFIAGEPVLQTQECLNSFG